MRRAYSRPSAERFHEWRKSVKYNRYHAQLLCGIWEPVMQPVCDQLKRLSDLLGQEHDLAVMRTVLCDPANAFAQPAEVEQLLALLDRRRDRLRARAHPTAKRLYAEKSSRYVKRVRVIWEAWQSEQKLD
jgi:CHAD domain-containing protein